MSKALQDRLNKQNSQILDTVGFISTLHYEAKHRFNGNLSQTNDVKDRNDDLIYRARVAHDALLELYNAMLALRRAVE